MLKFHFSTPELRKRIMEQSVLTVSVPRELLTDSGFSEETAAMEMLKLFVINLYRHQQISGGKAAEILGIRKYDFIIIIGDCANN